MYSPYFTITPKIAKNIEGIGVVFGFFQSITLPPSYQKDYVTRVITDTVHSSTAIEGNQLTNQQVGDVLSNRKITAYEKDIQEVKNYHKAVKFIQSVDKKIKYPITEKLVKDINCIILKSLDKEKESGTYRILPMYVGDYVAPDAHEVPQLMKEFIHWIQNPTPQDISPILIAGISHYRFVAIHPFIDGNGRTTRVLTKLILMCAGYDITHYFSLENFYNRNRMDYYAALSSVDKYRIDNKENLTLWLEYFTGGMLVEAQRAHSRIRKLQEQSVFITKPIHINANQKKVLVYLKKNKTLKTGDYTRLTGLSRKGAYNDLDKLVHAKLLKSLGTGKGSYYILTREGMKYA